MIKMDEIIKMMKKIYMVPILIGVVIMLFPFFWMLMTSFKSPMEILAVPPSIFPQNATINNYIEVMSRIPIWRYFFNSCIVSVVSTIIVLLTSAFAGTVFAKYTFPFKNFLFLIILGTTMIPFESYMIPYYLIVSKIGLVDTYTGIISPLLISTFGIFLMRQHVASIPNDLMDAGRIDGCSELGIFYRIILPLSKAPLAALTIFYFMFAWAFFLWPLIITNSKELYVLEVGLAMFQNSYAVEYGPVMAGASISVVPVILVFLFFRRHIISGMTISGMKS
jgi:multiple sugar transport system permease protein